MKTCCTCKLGKPEEAFGKNRSTRDRLQKQCKVCRAERAATNSAVNTTRARAWAAQNPDRRREIARNWATKHPATLTKNAAKRRSRLRDAVPAALADCPIEKAKLAAIYQEARQQTLVTGIPHEVDHVTPLAIGGTHESSNLRVITAQTNRKKSASFYPHP